MDLGTGVLAGCAIISGVIGTVRLLPKNGKYVSQKQFDMLNDNMTEGFKDMREDLKGIHQRIDRILEK